MFVSDLRDAPKMMMTISVIYLCNDLLDLRIHEGHDEDMGGDRNCEHPGDEDDFPLPGSWDSN